MLRTLFSILGVMFAALLVFSASFLGNVAADLDRRSADYEALAVDVTRELARTWKLADIREHYVADARDELLPVFDADLGDLKPLGPLLHADNVRIETRWSRDLWQNVTSAGGAAEHISDLILRSAPLRASRRMGHGPAWFETREDALLTMRVIHFPATK